MIEITRRYSIERWKEIRYAYNVFEELIGFAEPMSVILNGDGVTVLVKLKKISDVSKFNRCF